jgi:hypothetical protein
MPKKMQSWFSSQTQEASELGILPGNFSQTNIIVYGWKIIKSGSSPIETIVPIETSKLAEIQQKVQLKLFA